MQPSTDVIDSDVREPDEAPAPTTETSAFITPDWLVGANDDEKEALGHLIGSPVRFAPDAELAATASQLLGALRQQSVELERYAEAERAEIARVQSRYDAVKSRVMKHITAIEQQLAIVAEGLEYGKKKSRILGNGSVGFRAVPERLSITDSVVLVGWAGQHAPELVRKEVKLSVPQAAAKEYFTSTGEIPEGCELVPASQKFVYSIAQEEA